MSLAIVLRSHLSRKTPPFIPPPSDGADLPRASIMRAHKEVPFALRSFVIRPVKESPR